MKLDGRELLLRGVSEAEFQEQILELAVVYGWLVCHFRPGTNRRGSWSTPINGAPGFPDITMVRPPRLLFVELKARLGKVTLEQTRWLLALRASGAETYIWRPGDLESATAVLRK